MLWAKADQDGGEGWLPLYQHMTDSSAVARLLVQEWLAPAVRDQIVDHAGGSEEALSLVSWLTALHDIGKATPGFQYKVDRLAERVRDLGLVMPDGYLPHPPSHAYMSQALLYRCLQQEHGWEGSVATTYAIVLGGHHGAPPNSGAVRSLLTAPIQKENLGDDNWAVVQRELIQYATCLTGADPYLARWRGVSLPPTLQMLLTGVVIMADWIASNTDFFPLLPNADLRSIDIRVHDAWKALALPPPWLASHELTDDDDALLKGRFFGLLDDVHLRAAQIATLSAVSEMSGPGLTLVEAPMGVGKTEAALLAAERIAARHGEGGVAFLLPTMATSNAMFTRLHQWVNALPTGCQQQSVSLAHGKAELNAEYQNLIWHSSHMGDDPRQSAEPDVAIVNSWLTGRKRTLLSSFVVGTVDQMLMAGLKARHVAMRHLGLAGKVVIVDEVHAYDAYMSVYLDRVLRWLGSYRVPVILLSATLPSSRRRSLMQAYAGRLLRRAAVPPAPQTAASAPAYPLITTCDDSGVHYTTCADDSRRLTVRLNALPDDDAALLDLLSTAMSEGGCVGIIRNTVSRAQATYRLLQESTDAQVILTHSRFIACDRLTNDAKVLRLLGKDAETRRHKLIVVGTQVLEQSLDIDFDLLVTDIAPVDLLFQRIGRLHRHAKWDTTRPTPLREPRCVITGITDWQTQPPTIAKGITMVYQTALLWRTLAALPTLANRSGVAEIRLPDDISPLIEAVYERTGTVPNGWSDTLEKASVEMDQAQRDKENRAGGFLLPPVPPNGENLTGLLDYELSGADDDNQRGQAAVRDGIDSIEVVLVQRTADGCVRLLPWVEMEDRSTRPANLSDVGSRLQGMADELSTDFEPDRRVARLAATCTVSLPPSTSRYADSVIRFLENHGGFAGWQQSRWLRGQLPLIVDESLNADIIVTPDRRFRLHYDRELGLELIDEEDGRA